MTTLVDTNVLIDVAVRDRTWLDWSRRWIAACGGLGELAINQIIYAEFSYRYTDPIEVERLLPETDFRRSDLPWESAFAAARAYSLYRNAGGLRGRMLPDFLIGAHAAFLGYSILTRDPSGYRRYFPDLDIIAPDTHP